MNKQNYNDSDELLELLASMTARTVTGFMRWKILDFEPVTWIDPSEGFTSHVESGDYGFAQSVIFTCSYEKYNVSLDLYEELTAHGTQGRSMYSLFFLLPDGSVLRRLDFQFCSNACLDPATDDRTAFLRSVHRLTDAIFTVMDEQLSALPVGTTQVFDSLIPASALVYDNAARNFIAQMREIYSKKQFLNFHLMVWETMYSTRHPN